MPTLQDLRTRGVSSICKTIKGEGSMNFLDVNPNECNEPKCKHGVNGGNRGGCSECPGGLNSEVSMEREQLEVALKHKREEIQNKIAEYNQLCDQMDQLEQSEAA